MNIFHSQRLLHFTLILCFVTACKNVDEQLDGSDFDNSDDAEIDEPDAGQTDPETDTTDTSEIDGNDSDTSEIDSDDPVCIENSERCVDTVIERCHDNNWIKWKDCAGLDAFCVEVVDSDGEVVEVSCALSGFVKF